MKTIYTWSAQMIGQTAKLQSLAPRSVDMASHNLGLRECEPLMIAMDALVKYAAAYEARFETKLAEDSFLGAPWLRSLASLRELLNGDGAVAMARGITTDSKSNGACEGLFWDALKIAGFQEEDLITKGLL